MKSPLAKRPVGKSMAAAGMYFLIGQFGSIGINIDIVNLRADFKDAT